MHIEQNKQIDHELQYTTASNPIHCTLGALLMWWRERILAAPKILRPKNSIDERSWMEKIQLPNN